jgi:uncharacterized membrane protein (DUF485 family)
MDHRPDPLGILLFGFYSVVYAGYILISTFFPEAAAAPFLAGVNVAVIYGVGLIVLALVLAVIYLAKAKKS